MKAMYGMIVLRPESVVKTGLSDPYYVESYGKAGWLLVWAGRLAAFLVQPLLIAVAVAAIISLSQ